MVDRVTALQRFQDYRETHPLLDQRFQAWLVDQGVRTVHPVPDALAKAEQEVLRQGKLKKADLVFLGGVYRWGEYSSYERFALGLGHQEFTPAVANIMRVAATQVRDRYLKSNGVKTEWLNSIYEVGYGLGTTTSLEASDLVQINGIFVSNPKDASAFVKDLTQQKAETAVAVDEVRQEVVPEYRLWTLKEAAAYADVGYKGLWHRVRAGRLPAEIKGNGKKSYYQIRWNGKDSLTGGLVKPYWTKEEQDLLKENIGEKTVAQIAELLNRKRKIKSIYQKAEELGLSIYDNDGRFSVAELSRSTGISETKLLRWIYSGRIEAVKVGQPWRIDWDGVTPLEPQPKGTFKNKRI